MVFHQPTLKRSVQVKLDYETPSFGVKIPKIFELATNEGSISKTTSRNNDLDGQVTTYTTCFTFLASLYTCIDSIYTWIFYAKILPFARFLLVNFSTNFAHLENPGMYIVYIVHSTNPLRDARRIACRSIYLKHGWYKPMII